MPAERISRKTESKDESPRQNRQLAEVFAGIFGIFLGLCLLKFGNPVVLEKYVEEPPHDILEWLINGWPPVWCYWAMGVMFGAGIILARWNKGVPKILAVLPVAWLAWQLIAGTRTVDATLTRWTLVHFASCVASFYLGLLVLGRLRNPRPFLSGLLAGGAITVMLGFEQHFGGLEETRKFFLAYTPDPSRIAPEMFNRVMSNRIYSTLFYPDTLAGAVLMLLPMGLGVVWSMKRQLSTGARWLAMALVGIPALACLYWTESKGGWLLSMALAIVACGFLRAGTRLKLLLISAILVLGLGGFAWRHMQYMKKGAPSAVARFDFWKAAVKITAEHPLLGTGPGTFGLSYRKYMKPGGEVPRMTHDDYLEQASDSGVAGAVLYLGMIAGSLLWSLAKGQVRSDPLILGVWIGILGWATHCLMEFHLYIPAMAWPAFALLGWLVAISSKESTTISNPPNIPGSG